MSDRYHPPPTIGRAKNLSYAAELIPWGVPSCHPIQTYHAMVDFADEAIGNFTKAIRAKNMWDELVIVFSADNGIRTDALQTTAAIYDRMQPGLNSVMSAWQVGQYTKTAQLGQITFH